MTISAPKQSKQTGLVMIIFNPQRFCNIAQPIAKCYGNHIQFNSMTCNRDFQKIYSNHVFTPLAYFHTLLHPIKNPAFSKRAASCIAFSKGQ